MRCSQNITNAWHQSRKIADPAPCVGTWKQSCKPEPDDDLSMAILAAAASDPRLLDPLRAELTGDLERILSDTQDTPGAMVVVLAIQGLRFQKLLGLPDGGADLRGRVIEQLRAMINELE